MIVTERLILRDYQINDFDRIYAFASLPDFSQYDTWGPHSVEDTRKFIANCIAKSEDEPKYKFEWVVCEKQSGLLIGNCSLRRSCALSQVASIGYGIDPEYQSNGYATEVAKAVIAFGFEQVFLSVIYATCDTRNIPSYKVMERAQMKRVGHLKEDKEIRGHIRDSYRYEVCSPVSLPASQSI